MNKYEKWKRETNRKLRRKAEEDRDSHIFHSYFFHKFFEGYKEYTEVDEKGKLHIKRVYEGITYNSELSKTNYWLVRLLYILLFAGIAASLVFAALTQGTSGSALYVILPEIATILLIFWLLYTLFVSYLIVPKTMTIDDYRSSHGSLMQVSLYLTIAMLLDALATALYPLISGNSDGMISFFIYLIGAVLAAALHLIEKRLPYHEHIPEKSPDDDTTHGIDIEYEESKLL